MIRVTAAVRALSLELDTVIKKFNALQEQLSDRDLPEQVAVDLGADREIQKRIILGVAWRLNQASTEKPTSAKSRT